MLCRQLKTSEIIIFLNILKTTRFYLVEHDRLHAVTQHLSKLSGNHRLAATLEIKEGIRY